jgi:hypothetical protein
MKLSQHGDTKATKTKSQSISGHSYNPATGTIDTFVDGQFSHVLCQLHEPRPQSTPKYVVGASSHLKLDYASGPTPWLKQSMVWIGPKK